MLTVSSTGSLRSVAVISFFSLLLSLTLIYRILETPYWSYNAGRLMPSFMLAAGKNPYQLTHSGQPLMSVVYGPVNALTYMPATLMRSPVSAVLAGSVIAVLSCFGVLALMHFSMGRGRDWIVASFSFLTAGFLACHLEPLRYSCIRVHADAPGLALGGLACIALYYRHGRRPMLALWLSAACAVLAAFAKQPFALIAFGLLAYLLLADGARVFWRFLICLVASALVIGGFFFTAFGPQQLFDNLVRVPGMQPWPPSTAQAFLQSTRFFVRLMLPVWVALMTVGMYLIMSKGIPAKGWRVFLRNHPSTMLFFAGFALIPSSLAGHVRMGGDINSLSFAAFFFVCGLTLSLRDIASRVEDPQSRILAVAVIAALLIPVAVFEAPLALAIPREYKNLKDSELQRAFVYLQQHPGRAYFPWFPLSHYFAEGRFYHFAFGIFDRVSSGDVVTPAELRPNIPAQAQVVVIGNDGMRVKYGFDLADVLPDHHCLIRDPELSGWHVYAKAGAGNKCLVCDPGAECALPAAAATTME